MRSGCVCTWRTADHTNHCRFQSIPLPIIINETLVMAVLFMRLKRSLPDNSSAIDRVAARRQLLESKNLAPLVSAKEKRCTCSWEMGMELSEVRYDSIDRFSSPSVTATAAVKNKSAENIEYMSELLSAWCQDWQNHTSISQSLAC